MVLFLALLIVFSICFKRLQADAKRATDELNSTQQQISDLQKTLAELNKTYEDAMEKKRVIEEETAIMERRKIGMNLVFD